MKIASRSSLDEDVYFAYLLYNESIEAENTKENTK